MTGLDQSLNGRGETIESIQNRPHVKFSPTEAVSHDGIELLPPKTASAFSHDLINNTQNVSTLNHRLFRRYVKTHDAMTLGWILFSPLTFRVNVDGNNTSFTAFDKNKEHLIEEEDLDGDTAITIQSLWDIMFPDGYEGIIIEPIISDTTNLPILQKSVSDEIGSSVIQFTFLIEEGGQINRGDPVAQLIPVPCDDYEGSFNTLTTDEERNVAKETRRRAIYPDIYKQEREHNSAADLVTTTVQTDE